MRLRKPPREVTAATNVAAPLLDSVTHGNGCALAYVDPLGVIESIKFANIAREAAQWSELMRNRGVRPGDRVVVLAGRDRHWRSALLGVLGVGGAAVLCPAQTR